MSTAAAARKASPKPVKTPPLGLPTTGASSAAQAGESVAQKLSARRQQNSARRDSGRLEQKKSARGVSPGRVSVKSPSSADAAKQHPFGTSTSAKPAAPPAVAPVAPTPAAPAASEPPAEEVAVASPEEMLDQLRDALEKNHARVRACTRTCLDGNCMQALHPPLARGGARLRARGHARARGPSISPRCARARSRPRRTFAHHVSPSPCLLHRV